MEQDGKDGSSIGIPPVSSKRKTLEFRSEPFLGSYKPSEFRSEPFLGGYKPSEFRSEPFLGREKPWEFHSEPFLDEKNLGIPFQTILEREKTSEFCSESFLEEKKLPNSVPNHAPKHIHCFNSTVCGFDGGNQTHNIAVYTWRFSTLSYNCHPIKLQPSPN
jgi:hypothetical protein